MNDRHVSITRTYDAPRELVWAAWTEPDQVARWWGPDEFETPRDSVEIDLRVGGHFNLVMVEAGSGSEFPVRQEITEVVDQELLVMRSPAQPEVGLDHETTCRVELSEADGKTIVSVKTGPFTERMEPMAQAGWNAQMQRLEALLTQTAKTL